MISNSQTISPNNKCTEKVFAVGDADGGEEEDENELVGNEAGDEVPEVLDVDDAEGQ